MKKLKIRASAGSQIMTSPRKKTDKYSGTLKTFVENWYKEQLYQRRNEFSSKQTEKGNRNEDLSIEILSEHLGVFMMKYDGPMFEDDYFTGTPDVITPDFLVDIKNSWSPFSFPLFKEDIEKAYFIQGQIYMHLTGARKYKLVYTLTDTPIDLIEREARNYSYSSGVEFDDSLLRSFIEKMTYKDVPSELKIKIFEFDYDPEVVQELKEKVELAREYLNTIKL